MKTTKSLFIALLLGWATGTQAGDYTHLTMQKSDSTTLALDVALLTMTFADGQLVAANDRGSYTFALADLSRMFFSKASSTGLDAVATDAGSMPVTVYTLAGVSLGQYDSLATFTRRAAKGVYLVKCNGRTFKTTVK